VTIYIVLIFLFSCSLTIDFFEQNLKVNNKNKHFWSWYRCHWPT